MHERVEMGWKEILSYILLLFLLQIIFFNIYNIFNIII